MTIDLEAIRLVLSDEYEDVSRRDAVTLLEEVDRLRAELAVLKLAQSEGDYCDVCGESTPNLRSPVEVCRDCYDVARMPAIGRVK